MNHHAKTLALQLGLLGLFVHLAPQAIDPAVQSFVWGAGQ